MKCPAITLKNLEKVIYNKRELITNIELRSFFHQILWSVCSWIDAVQSVFDVRDSVFALQW